MPALQQLAEGLMTRYQKAGQHPPQVLYTDRDCCKTEGLSKYNDLFDKWPEMQVRLDVFNFMRRLAAGVTTESHPLYGTFMNCLSCTIFEWDKDDYERLCQAKKGQLSQAGVPNPTDSAVR